MRENGADKLADAGRRMETGTRILSVTLILWAPEEVSAFMQCDLPFWRLDTIDGY